MGIFISNVTQWHQPNIIYLDLSWCKEARHMSGPVCVCVGVGWGVCVCVCVCVGGGGGGGGGASGDSGFPSQRIRNARIWCFLYVYMNVLWKNL